MLVDRYFVIFLCAKVMFLDGAVAVNSSRNHFIYIFIPRRDIDVITSQKKEVKCVLVVFFVEANLQISSVFFRECLLTLESTKLIRLYSGKLGSLWSLILLGLIHWNDLRNKFNKITSALSGRLARAKDNPYSWRYC